MQKKPITNKLLWIFAVGQFGWSLLSGIVTNWMVYYYTGSPDAQNPNTGIFAAGITQHPILFKLTLFGLVMAVGRVFDLRPSAIIRDLKLQKPVYRQLASYGHIGREDLGVEWERLNRVDKLKSVVAELCE